MSPQHFKNFCRAMNETLKAYESVFGALAIPDSETAPAHTAEQLAGMLKQARERAAAGRRPSDPISSTGTKPLSKRSRGAARK
jgi:hypothetical protein